MMESSKVIFLSFNYNDAISRPMRISTRLIFICITIKHNQLSIKTYLQVSLQVHRDL